MATPPVKIHGDPGSAAYELFTVKHNGAEFILPNGLNTFKATVRSRPLPKNSKGVYVELASVELTQEFPDKGNPGTTKTAPHIGKGI